MSISASWITVGISVAKWLIGRSEKKQAKAEREQEIIREWMAKKEAKRK